MTVLTTAAEQTELEGSKLARGLKPGDVVLVSGDLGAGKTTFVRGACAALGVTDVVSSPTYAIGQVYAGPGIEVAHLDLYRIESAAHEPGLLEDYLTPERVGFVEWPGEGDAFGRVTATVRISHAGGDRREIEVTTP